jgi:hypothetical protein
MKLFEESKGKSWSVKLEKGNENHLIAVDDITGQRIAYLITFKRNGVLLAQECAIKAFIAGGYDPYEHGNTFDEQGRIIVDYK